MLATATANANENELQLKEIKSIGDLKITDETEDRKPFHEDWGYEKTNGPAVWAQKYPRANGKHQSPIDIITSEAIFNDQLLQKPLEFSYDNQCFAKIQNTGHSFIVAGSDGANSSIYILFGRFCLRERDRDRVSTKFIHSSSSIKQR